MKDDVKGRVKPPRREWDKAAEKLILWELDDPKITSKRLEGYEKEVKWLTDWVRKQRQFLQAINTRDFAAFERLMEDTNIRRVVFEFILTKRRKGRPEGASPLPERIQNALTSAADEIPIIKTICQENGIRYRRDNAIELAARHHSVDPRQLISYLKNKSRRHK
jgi:hypothetical protein